MTRPTPAEHIPYFSRYIDLVPDGDILGQLQTQQQSVFKNLQALSLEQQQHRYAPNKWNTLEIVRHISDTERVFTFRATHIARRDPNPLPGFDQDQWLEHAPIQPLETLLEEWRIVRLGSIALFSSLSKDDWAQLGTASGGPLTPNAAAYIIVGHLMHHQKLWLEHYGFSI